VATLSGLALPATRAAGGYFATKTGVDVAWGDLLLAILCPIGGRVMSRSFGSDVPLAVFSQNDATLMDQLARSIRDAAARHAPHVSIIDVQTKTDKNTVNLTVAFAFGGDTVTKTTRIDRRSALQFISARSR
jgi:phage baseplate assembly protein W